MAAVSPIAVCPKLSAILRSAGATLNVNQRAMLWLAATQATSAATQAVDLMFSAGGLASVYANVGLERCMRDIRTAAQHLVVVRPIMK